MFQKEYGPLQVFSVLGSFGRFLISGAVAVLLLCFCLGFLFVLY